MAPADNAATARTKTAGVGTRLLELTTIDPDRPLIAVDGTGYELALPDDFGLVELARIQRLQATVAAVMGREELSDDDAENMGRALDGFVALVMPGLPADKRARLRDPQKLAIIKAFQGAAESQGQPLPLKTAPRRKKNLTGGR